MSSSQFQLQSQNTYEYQFLVHVGDQMPDFEVPLNNGSVFKRSDQRGKVVMLQFTASWCGVCRKKCLILKRKSGKKLKDKDFVLIGLDYQEEPEKVNDFAKQMNISYPLAYDDSGEIFHSIAAKGAGVTRNIIINRNGKIIYLSCLFRMDKFNEM